MARLVIPRSVKAGNFAAASYDDQPADGYADRLVKYIPAESVAFFACADKLIASHFGIDSTAVTLEVASNGACYWSLGVFLLGLFGTPVYLYKRRLPNQPWLLNVGIATLAYIGWTYTLGGSLFVLLGWYSVFFAGLVGPVFSFLAGCFEPKP